MSSTARTEPVGRLTGAIAARILSVISWIVSRGIYGILLLLYRVDRRLLVGSLIALPLLVALLVWVL
jgi:hypothetical protein